MRDFETDFNFEFEEGIRCRRTVQFRIDKCPSLSIGTIALKSSSGREARIQAHRKRVQADLKENYLLFRKKYGLDRKRKV